MNRKSLVLISLYRVGKICLPTLKGHLTGRAMFPGHHVNIDSPMSGNRSTMVSGMVTGEFMWCLCKRNELSQTLKILGGCKFRLFYCCCVLITIALRFPDKCLFKF